MTPPSKTPKQMMVTSQIESSVVNLPRLKNGRSWLHPIAIH